MKENVDRESPRARQSSPTRLIRRQQWRQGVLPSCRDSADEVVEETPVALVYNGISHVVMMATPADLEDFALGFSLSEGILAEPGELLDVEIAHRDQGLELNLTILSRRSEQLRYKRRNLTGRTGCGLCGAESLASAIQVPPVVSRRHAITHAAVDRAIRQLPARQPLQARTGGMHAAAWCSQTGDIRLMREDVGRHNAVDKLIGALRRQGVIGPGFVVVTSRASYEIAFKTAMAGVAVLVAVSAPTAMAIDLADNSGITLVGFTGPGHHAIYAGALS